MANPVGRPPKYNKALLDKANEYLVSWDTQTEDVIPSIEGLSDYIEIARSTIYEWAKAEDKKDFSDTLDKLESKQKRVLLNKGLSGEFNSNITKLALGNHGMSEKMQQDSISSDGTMSPPQVIEIVAKE